jgi:hypothetical protein
MDMGRGNLHGLLPFEQNRCHALAHADVRHGFSPNRRPERDALRIRIHMFTPPARDAQAFRRQPVRKIHHTPARHIARKASVATTLMPTFTSANP